MGIPYSKQINSAFDQVTPLVAAGFEVLQTTKNISILLAAIQVLTALLLGLILIALSALLVTVNPDLEKERRTIVSPVIRWFACWIMPDCEPRSKLVASIWFTGIILVSAGALWFFSYSTDVEKPAAEESSPSDDDAEVGKSESPEKGE